MFQQQTMCRRVRRAHRKASKKPNLNDFPKGARVTETVKSVRPMALVASNGAGAAPHKKPTPTTGHVHTASYLSRGLRIQYIFRKIYFRMIRLVPVDNFRVIFFKREESLFARWSETILSVVSSKIGKTLKSARHDMASSYIYG